MCPLEASAAALPLDPRAMAVQFVDESILKLMLADERIEIVTPHGTLLVPTNEIRRIEFALRLPAEAAAQNRRSDRAARGPRLAVHEPAEAERLAQGDPVWLALVKASEEGGPSWPRGRRRF